MIEDRGQMIEDRGQRTEGRGQRTDGRGQKWFLTGNMDLGLLNGSACANKLRTLQGIDFCFDLNFGFSYFVVRVCRIG